MLVEGGDAVVVEARGDGAEHRQVLQRAAEGFPVALELATHVAQGVLGAPTLELVDGDGVGEVEHVDLLELAGRAELRGHHVQGHVDDLDDARVALADARRLDDHQVVAGGLARDDHVLHVLGDLGHRPAGGERPHEHVGVVDGVHADPVAEQRAPGPPACGIDGHHRDAQLVLVVEAEAPHQLVGERGLAGPTRAGDAEHRHGTPAAGPAQVEELVAPEGAALDGGDHPSECPMVAVHDVVDGVRRELRGEVDVARLDDGVDHAGQAEPLAVLGREHVGHAVVVQLGDLVGHDHAAAPAVHLGVGAALGPQTIDQVAEELDVAALVGADRDALGVLLHGRPHDLVDRAVVAQVDHLGALRLEDPPHDVDGGVVAVEEAGGRDQADGMNRPVDLRDSSPSAHGLRVVGSPRFRLPRVGLPRVGLPRVCRPSIGHPT